MDDAGAQRFGLSVGAVEGQHQLGPERLPERVGVGHPPELTHHRGVMAEDQLGLDPVLDRRQP